MFCCFGLDFGFDFGLGWLGSVLFAWCRKGWGGVEWSWLVLGWFGFLLWWFIDTCCVFFFFFVLVGCWVKVLGSYLNISCWLNLPLVACLFLFFCVSLLCFVVGC